jgi:hypothetical protein
MWRYFWGKWPLAGQTCCEDGRWTERTCHMTDFDIICIRNNTNFYSELRCDLMNSKTSRLDNCYGEWQCRHKERASHRTEDRTARSLADDGTKRTRTRVRATWRRPKALIYVQTSSRTVTVWLPSSWLVRWTSIRKTCDNFNRICLRVLVKLNHAVIMSVCPSTSACLNWSKSTLQLTAGGFHANVRKMESSFLTLALCDTIGVPENNS